MYGILLVSKGTEKKPKRRKNEKSVFHSERAQISRALDRCQTCAGRYYSGADGASDCGNS